MMQRREDIVKWFKEEKDCGRIMLDEQDGNHVFVHYTGIKPDPARFSGGFRFLEEGQKVSFDLVEKPAISDSQKRSAINVELLGDLI
ncbi:MAG: cold-shock protein [Bacilli bacterium]